MFHPIAIEALITRAINSNFYLEEDVFFYNEQWHCFDAHSKLSSPSKETLLKSLNNEIASTNKQIRNSTHIIITLGTSWVYSYKETSSVVANCHKIPQKQFSKELLSVNEVANSLKNMLSIIRSVNYNAQVLFTVSPIRHTKDGFIENAQSKAHLISAIHQVVKNQSHYFPSYEIMMDELRDYRFYSEDMIHPNNTAINYIWEKFKTVWMSSKAEKTMEDVEVIQKGLQHKPFNPNSEAHIKFLENLESKIKKLQFQFNFMKF